MRYLLLFIISILITLASISQKQTSKMDIESLKKYSYLVSGDTNLINAVGHAQGTGFFIERSNRIFFVTSKHTLSGCNNGNIKDERYPDIMNINLNNDVIPINTTPIKDSAKCLPMVLDPDVIAHPLNKKEIKKSSINVINKYEGKKPEKSQEIVLWGFPNSSDRIDSFVSNDFVILTSLDVTLDGKSFFKDEIHYCITVNDKRIDESMVGFSGSGVFLRDSNSGKFVFIGVLCGTHIPANGLYVVQPKYLYDLLK